MPSDERREQFIAAAIAVIRREGLTRATTRRVAEEAGAPLAMLHYCFRSKEELVAEVARSLHGQGVRVFADAVTPGMGLTEGVRAVLDALTPWMEATSNDQLTEYELHIWAIRHHHEHLARETYQGWLDRVQTALEIAQRDDEPKRDLETLARSVVAILDGYNIQDRFLGQREYSRMVPLATVGLIRAIEAGDYDFA